MLEAKFGNDCVAGTMIFFLGGGGGGGYRQTLPVI